MILTPEDMKKKIISGTNGTCFLWNGNKLGEIMKQLTPSLL
jgi:hypothetical protein